MNYSSITPFVKWVGGKRQLLNEITHRLPKKYNRYYEPFVGGGAVLFSLLPEIAFINDVNRSLVNAYIVIRDQLSTFTNYIDALDNGWYDDGKHYYYSVRDRYNTKLIKHEYDVEMAALFVFINKHCFNGLYRVNRNGVFNVPYNNTFAKTLNGVDIVKISQYLQGVTISVGDFEEACCSADKGDFIFFDSPYIPLKSTTFVSYTKEQFDERCHMRLAELFDKLTSRGCYCMLTNHNTDLIYDLYGDKGYNINILPVKRMINSDASNRVGEEVIICNY